MEAFLRELEPQLAKMTPGERQAFVRALADIARGIDGLGGRIRPSPRAAFGFMTDLARSMISKKKQSPFAALVARSKSGALKIGPNVDAFLQAL